MSNVTIVTGLWDLNRDSIDGWGKRSFDQYKQNFFTLLKCENPMVIYAPDYLHGEIENIRGPHSKTLIVHKNVKDFEEWNPFFNKINSIRKDPNWRNFAGWLSGSPQAELEHYNAMMFTKMFMLHDSSVMNPFGHEYFFWLDGGITSTVHPGYFNKDKVLEKLPSYIQNQNENKSLFITYPYTANEEIHGFTRAGMSKYCGVDHVNYVARGGFFGGHKSSIKSLNNLYYGYMENTLSENLMGADECLFTILCHKHQDLIKRFEISSNGLVWPFFEHLKNFNPDSEPIKDEASLDISDQIVPNYTPKEQVIPKNKASLYVLTFNSPEQLETLFKSFKQVPNFLNSFSQKYVVDNSLDEKCFEPNRKICEDNGFHLIKKENLGICGGRQFIAEHFDKTDSEYMIFFEDDMFLNPPSEQGFCKNGFRKFIPNLASKSVDLMKKHGLDFLKWSFTEFYGDNKTQWSWYNVPQSVRSSRWPNYDKLPEMGLDPNAPLVDYKHIYCHDDVPFVTGECYYCNWPVMVSKEGNRKMFLNVKWARPYEQTWMSHIFQETSKGNIKPAILLASPITHDRFVHYAAEIRKES